MEVCVLCFLSCTLWHNPRISSRISDQFYVQLARRVRQRAREPCAAESKHQEPVTTQRYICVGFMAVLASALRVCVRTSLFSVFSSDFRWMSVQCNLRSTGGPRRKSLGIFFLGSEWRAQWSALGICVVLRPLQVQSLTSSSSDSTNCRTNSDISCCKI